MFPYYPREAYYRAAYLNLGRDQSNFIDTGGMRRCR